jgi:4-amino-4-deoxy-L-arabinose transferase-like glycosyltransferase
MAARSDAHPAPWRIPFHKWLDSVEGGPSIPFLLIGFVIVWTAYLVIAYFGSDLHPDVLETWTLGRRLEWGYPKHPPLTGWVARFWTAIFPLADWSFQLLAIANAALGLWAVDRITARFVKGERRIVVLLLLMLLPIYQFHAQRFNANTILLSLWPLATYCFLRSFEDRTLGWAVAAGVSGAFAMLGKYYSVFLIASFIFAALAHPARRNYFRSWSPWVSALIGLAVLSPHIHWLAVAGAPTFNHALAHAGASFPMAATEVLFFVAGIAATLAPAALTWLFIAGYQLKQLPDDFRTMNSGLWLLCLIACGTIAIPVVTSLSVGTDLPSLWALQGLFLFVVLVVCSSRFEVSRFHCTNLAVMVAGTALVAVAVGAPIHAIYRNHHGYEEGRNLYRATALEITRQWRATTGTPFLAVSGDDALAFATAFYSPEHPYYARPFQYQYMWGLPRKTTLERGWAGICFADQAVCIDWMKRTAERAQDYFQVEFEVSARLLGTPGVSRKVTALIVPPLSSSRPSPSVGNAEEFSSAKRPATPSAPSGAP